MDSSYTAFWHTWCRLCAKEGADNSIPTTEINDALARYFLVRTSNNGGLPNCLCSDCLTLVTSTMKFSKHVQRVQEMYTFLSENPNEYYDFESIRVRFHIYEYDRNRRNSKTSTFKDNQNFIDAVNGTDGGDISSDQNMLEKCSGEASYKLVDEQNIGDIGGHCGVTCSYDTDEVIDPFDDRSNDAPNGEANSKPEEEYRYVHMCNKKTKKTKRKTARLQKARRGTPQVYTDFQLNGECKICGELLNLYSSCVEHMRQNHGFTDKKHWECPLCERKLQSDYNFERHMRTHIPVEERKTKQCTLCASRFTSKAQLEAHMHHKHTNDKPFVCEVCGLSLRTYSNLRQHQMIIHSDIKPFECDVCQKKFKNSYRLKIHMDTHSPNKHVCSQCGLQLNSRATLNRHYLVHSDEMKHNCDYCGRAFKRAKALKNHLLLHTGLKPYACEFCDRTFANGSNCRSHMKKLHPDQLAALEASGNKSHTKNIPKLETLKAVTKAADNLTPVVTKFSGCFAFGKKPRLESSEILYNLKTQCSPNKSSSQQHEDHSIPQDGIHSSSQNVLSCNGSPVPDEILTTPTILNNVELDTEKTTTLSLSQQTFQFVKSPRSICQFQEPNL
ncbi:zinc finger protein weckle [Musca vetustissima]|uniref:zinc finger protein weckle n=1 Tax=Musca vetustissima TaxID=27455 RepID=UPI002AB7138D|nr:zinc finger protein weckle [Musca vetustissima]